MSEKQLTTKQQLFCSTYLANGFNATQAAITAGYSEDTARQIGNDNLSKVYIRDYLDKEIDFMIGDVKGLTYDLIAECKKYAFMSDSEMEILQVRASDKKSYLDMLFKYQGLYTEKKDISITTPDENGKPIGITSKGMTQEECKDMFFKLKNEN